MALKLSDVVLRRTDLGSGENPGGDALNETAELMGKELGWDKSRIKREIEETNAVYVPANL
jgi:glycerol-3-phosphate dehydrogenase